MIGARFRLRLRFFFRTSFLIRALQKLEESDRRAQHTMDQLQREQRYLRRRLEQLGVERTRMDSTGSNLSSEKWESDQGGLPQGPPLGWGAVLIGAARLAEAALLSVCSRRDICWIWQLRGGTGSKN